MNLWDLAAALPFEAKPWEIRQWSYSRYLDACEYTRIVERRHKKTRKS